MTDRGARSPLPEQQAAERRVAALRASTQLRVESLARQVDAIVESSTWTANDDEHDPEGATIAFERAQLQALLAQARADLVDIDRAAERPNGGTAARRHGGTAARRHGGTAASITGVSAVASGSGSSDWPRFRRPESASGALPPPDADQ